MELHELINQNLVKLELNSSTKEEVIKELIDLVEQEGKISNRKAVEKAVFNREGEGSTGVGYGVAIPHGKSKGVKETTLAFGRKKEGVDFASLDDKVAKLFFLIVVPEKSEDTHLKVLSKLSRALMHEELRNDLLEADSKQKILDAIKEHSE